MHRRPRLLLLLAPLLAVVAAPTRASTQVVPMAPPSTWRLDLFHTGGPNGLEAYALDRIVVEPRAWTGARDAVADSSGPGSYRALVRDSTGRLLFAHTYNTIFGEWATTAERRVRARTFHESIRFPAPPAPVDVVLERRDERGTFRELWRTRVDPSDRTIDRARRVAPSPIAIERHGDPASKVDLLFVGDGYTAAQCREKFVPDARRMLRALFAQEPFAGRRTDFNVWGLCPPSPEPGISRPSAGVHVASPVGATYDAFGSERYVLTFETRALRELAAAAPYDAITVLVNAATYGGGGIYGEYSTVAVDNDWADYLFVHEFAHHFAGLADEYYTSPVAYEAPSTIVEPPEPNVTALLDTTRLKWAALRTPGSPLPTPWPKEAFEALQRDVQARRRQLREAGRPEREMSALFDEERRRTMALLGDATRLRRVGAFQGANYDARAFYRPEVDCIMFSRDPVGFCAVCRRALAAAIDRLVGRA